MQKRIMKHLKGDIKMFRKEATEDLELIKSMKKMKRLKARKNPDSEKKESKGQKKFEKVMREKKLHSGSKKGPLVKNPKQRLAIAFSEMRKAAKKK